MNQLSFHRRSFHPHPVALLLPRLAGIALMLAVSLPGLDIARRQTAELGPPPVMPHYVPPYEGPALAPAPQPAPSWLDISNRETVRQSYNNTFLPTDSVAMGWTGNHATCYPGTTTTAYKNAVLTRVNWFRAMAGMDPVSLESVRNSKSQEAALMMSVNKAINHYPPTSWTCYSANGAEAAANSNLCYMTGSTTDPGCVKLYIVDHGSGNTAVGHRRWILYPPSTLFGTGDVPETGSYPRTNALWVLPSSWPPRPPTREDYIAWPPPGYVPYQVVFARWSFAYPNADFSTASVSMMQGSTPISVQLHPVATGYGDNTLVWVAGGLDPNSSSVTWPKPSSDTVIKVTVSNVKISGVFRQFVYYVTIFDPATGGQETVSAPSTPTGPTAGTTGVAYSYSTSGATSSLGHAVQYFFDWGDGTNSGWLAAGVTSASHSWAAPGNYAVKAKARCATHTSIESSWSATLTVKITTPAETVSAPATPNGPTTGKTGVAYSYTTGGAVSNLGHAVQYLFDWGDGTNSGWLPVGTTSASHAWTATGTYQVRAKARCATHTGVESAWSGTRSVSISAATQVTAKTGVYTTAGNWLLDRNGNYAWNTPPTDSSFSFQMTGTPLVGDWSASGRQKAGIYNNGVWRLDYNGNHAWDGVGADREYQLGWAGAIPVVGDWNGDGRTKIGVYSNGFWFLDYNGNGIWEGGSVDKQIGFGWAGAMPVVGDWNGNGRTKIGVFSGGFWFLDYNGDFVWNLAAGDKQVGWGWTGVQPVTGDWNGDGKTKIGVYSNGFWFLDYNGDYVWNIAAGDKQVGWGWASVKIVTGDWNGNGKTKIGVVNLGFWFLDYDGNYVWDGGTTDKLVGWGASADTPVTGKW